jgi:hypothetical protein
LFRWLFGISESELDDLSVGEHQALCEWAGNYAGSVMFAQPPPRSGEIKISDWTQFRG